MPICAAIPYGPVKKLLLYFLQVRTVSVANKKFPRHLAYAQLFFDILERLESLHEVCEEVAGVKKSH